jgi:hypothetical protein
VAAASATTTTVPTQVLGEQFNKPVEAAAAPAAVDTTQLANTGPPISSGLALLLVVCGIVLAGGCRAVSGRRLEESLRSAAARESSHRER